MRALVLGATGLVGSRLLRQLLDEPAYSNVRVLLRRKVDDFPSAPGKLEVSIVDFAALQAEDFEAAEHVFCCLGTTIRQAGSQETFRKIDFEIPVRAAGLAAQTRARKFLIVSSVGADSKSRNFYLRVKGEIEAAISASGISETHFFRPSLLLGARAGSRPLERLSIALLKPLTPLMSGPALIYRPIDASRVARAMIAQALDPTAGPGHHVHQGADLG